MGYRKYSSITELLQKYYILNKDYIMIPNKTVQKESSGGRNKIDYYVTEECIKRVMINHSRCRNINIETNGIKINNLEIKYIEREITKEQSTVGFIKKALTHLNPIPQYYIKKNEKQCYSIDLYIEKYKIAIECDEDNHNNRDVNAEIEREKFVKNKLNCKFIRFNPDDKDFDITNVINQIIIEIENFKSSAIKQH